VPKSGLQKAGTALNGTNGSQGVQTHPSSTEDQSVQQNDVDVSDLDSDLELDELIPTYLKIKGKLYEIDPNLVETTTRKQSKSGKAKKGSSSQAIHSPAVRKLLSQLQKITSDALFDEWEAEAQWPARRNEIAQDRATKRQDQENQPNGEEKHEEKTASTPSFVPKMDSKLDSSTSPTDTSESDDEVDLLSGMFSAVPDALEPRQAEAENSGSENVALRDFGKSSGLTPRRLLEEAVRSR
jgi:ATP-dependent RNA helicase DHX29